MNWLDESELCNYSNFYQAVQLQKKPFLFQLATSNFAADLTVQKASCLVKKKAELLLLILYT